MAEFIKHPVILNRETSALLVIDIQERLFKAMRKYNKLLENVLKLVKGVKILNMPIYFSEQYPKGLGSTVQPIREEINATAVQKLTFSCSGADNLFQELKAKNIKQIIVCGIESHVCVQQTVLDLLANGFQVDVPVNGVSSRSKIDFRSAISRMEKHGAEITSVESILFELLQVCATPEFKAISSLVK